MVKKSRKLEFVKLSAIDEDILIVLKGRGELYGLEILDYLNLDRKDKLGKELGFGSLYPALSRLIKKKLVTWRWGEEESGGSRRKYFKINVLGLYSLNALHEYRMRLAGQTMSSQLGMRSF